MRSVHKHFWLYNRHESSNLSRAGVRGQIFCIFADVCVSWKAVTACLRRQDSYNRAPLSEFCAKRNVLFEAFGKPVKPFCYFFVRSASWRIHFRSEEHTSEL